MAIVQRAAIITLFACFFAVFLLLGRWLNHTLSALLTALVIAYLLNPLLNWLERRGFSRFLAIVLLYGLLALASLYASFFLIPYLGHQFSALTTALPRYLQHARGAILAWEEQLASTYLRDDLAWLVEHLHNAILHILGKLSGTGYQQVTGLVFAAFNLVLAPILVFFMLYYKEASKASLLKLVPDRLQEEFLEVGRRINRTLERFIVAQLVDCLLVGILCSLSLWLLGVEYPLLNGMLAGLASVVPFLGAMVAFIPPAFVGYAQSGDLTIIPKVAAAYFFVNVIIEGNLIKPLVMRGTLKLNPLWVIFALMAMGELMGFWGIILAVPLAAAVKICAAELKEYLAHRGERFAASEWAD